MIAVSSGPYTPRVPDSAGLLARRFRWLHQLPPDQSRADSWLFAVVQWQSRWRGCGAMGKYLAESRRVDYLNERCALVVAA